MIKYYCDLCGKEIIEKSHHDRIKGETPEGLSYEIILGWKGVWNKGNFHHWCILENIVPNPANQPTSQEAGE